MTHHFIDRGADTFRIAFIIQRCRNRTHFGGFGGYDIVNHLDDVLDEFDKVIGLKRLCAIHLNDSKNMMGSHKDRHEVIGGGNIGLEALVNVVNHPALKGLPFYLETPNELPGYAAEIALMRSREL